MSTTFTITPGTGDWEWAETTQVGEPTIVLYIRPTSITSPANVPAPKIGPAMALTDWELRVYSANPGTLITYIPRWKELSFSKVLNDTGAGSVTLDLDDEVFEDIGDTNILDKENVWSIFWNNVLVFAFKNEELGEVHVQEDGTRTVTMSGRGIGKDLEHAAILPPGYTAGGGVQTREWGIGEGSSPDWSSIPAMDAWLELLAAAQARWTAAGHTFPITPTFNATTDSKSQAWNDLQDLKLEPGGNLLAELSKFCELAEADWIVQPDGTLQVARRIMSGDNYVSGLGDRLDSIIRFQVGHDQVSFGRNRTRKDIRTALYVESDDGDVGEAVDSLAATTWQRREGYMKAGDAPDYVAAEEFAQKALPISREEAKQVNLTVLPDHENRIVFFDYDVGDWIAAESDDQRVVGGNPYRIVAISCGIDEAGRTTVELGCQTILQLAAQRMAKAISSGGGSGSLSAAGRTNLPSPTSPTGVIESASRQATVPPPTALDIDTGANENVIFADVSWVAGTGSTTMADPVVEYEAELTKIGAGVSQVVRTKLTTVRFTGLEPDPTPGTTPNYSVRVRAITRLGRSSAYLGGTGPGDFSSGKDTTIPATVTGVAIYAAMRSVTVTWTESADVDVANGNGAYDVQIDDNTSFNNANGRLQGKRVSGTIASFTNVPPAASQTVAPPQMYARIKAVDSSGNVSTNWSATAGPAALARIDTVLISDNAITTPMIQAGQINSDHVVTAGLDAGVIKFGEMSGDRIQANTIDANRIKTSTLAVGVKLTVGGLIQGGRTSTPHNYYVLDGTGFKLYAGGVYAGGEWSGGSLVGEFTVGITNPYTAAVNVYGGSINGTTITGGTFQTATSGARVVIDSTGIYATDGTTKKLEFLVADGSLTLRGNITSTATITGGVFQTGTGNPRVIIDSTGIRALNSSGTAVTTISSSTGVLTATGATIGGTINATGGTFSGSISSSATITASGNIIAGTGGRRVILDAATPAIQFQPRTPVSGDHNATIEAYIGSTFAQMEIWGPARNNVEQSVIILYEGTSPDNGFNVSARGGDMDFTDNFQISSNNDSVFFHMQSGLIILDVDKVEFRNASYYHEFFADGTYHCRGIGIGGDNAYNNGLTVRNGWIRMYGYDQGLYFEDYQGGWKMIDTTWMRSHNDKAIYSAGEIRSNSLIRSNDRIEAGGTIYVGVDLEMGHGVIWMKVVGDNAHRIWWNTALDGQEITSYATTRIYSSAQDAKLDLQGGDGNCVLYDNGSAWGMKNIGSARDTKLEIVGLREEHAAGSVMGVGARRFGEGGEPESGEPDSALRFGTWVDYHQDWSPLDKLRLLRPVSFKRRYTDRREEHRAELADLIASDASQQAINEARQRVIDAEKRWQARLDPAVQTPELGFIAEEVAEVEPRLVTPPSGEMPMGLMYGQFSALTVAAVQELDEEVNGNLVAVRATLDNLAEQVAGLDRRLGVLEGLAGRSHDTLAARVGELEELVREMDGRYNAATRKLFAAVKEREKQMIETAKKADNARDFVAQVMPAYRTHPGGPLDRILD